jgi:hypothetical protein
VGRRSASNRINPSAGRHGASRTWGRGRFAHLPLPALRQGQAFFRPDRVDIGDSFVVPTLMVLGTFVVAAAMWVDFTYRPPLWLHAVIWPPVILGLALIMIRALKSFFAVQQYHVRKSEMGL